MPLEAGVVLQSLTPGTSPEARVEKNKVGHCVTAIPFHTGDVQSDTRFKVSV